MKIHLREKENKYGIKYVVLVHDNDSAKIIGKETPILGFFKNKIAVGRDFFKDDIRETLENIYIKGRAFVLVENEDLKENLYLY